MNEMKAIIMAGGKGTRIYDSDNPMPKVMRSAGGRALIEYVFDSVDFIDNDDITVVVGFMADAVKSAFPDRHYALQGEDGYGTGYAVRCAVEQAGLADYAGNIIVLSGDAPCIKPETVRELCRIHEESGNACTLLSCVSKRPLPFGRIIRENGQITAIREQKDCSPEEKLITELNVGLYVFDAQKLISALGMISADNAANEYYLTDVPKIMLDAQERISAHITEDEDELWGVNTPEDLAAVEEVLRKRAAGN